MSEIREKVENFLSRLAVVALSIGLLLFGVNVLEYYNYFVTHFGE